MNQRVHHLFHIFAQTCLESGVVVGLGVALLGVGSIGVVALVVGVDGRLVSFDC